MPARKVFSAMRWLGLALSAWTVACSSSDNNGGPGGAGGGSDSSTPQGGGGVGTGGNAVAGGGGSSDATGGPSYTFTLIDDMETTMHGPILLTGISPPLNPGYWFNFGANVSGDTATPPALMFTFTPVPSSVTTLNGKTSTQAAHQLCSLNGQYDVCGLGFEFAQVPDVDAGTSPEAAVVDAARSDAADASSGIGDGGDGGPSVPMVTVPFDISQYKGISFWGKTTTDDAGTSDVKVQFPDTDTDPRGGVCNGPRAGVGSSTNITRCYNSYAVHKTFTNEWQQFTVLFSDLTIDPTFGFQQPDPFTESNAEAGQTIGSKNVYGINWQGQKNSIADAGAVSIDIWVDDVYFIQ